MARNLISPTKGARAAKQPGFVPEIQLLRGLAAMAVVVFHAQGELRHHGFQDPFPPLLVGAGGVDIFFIISGFVMVHSSDGQFGRSDSVKTFLVHRIIRLVPLYWLSSLAATFVAAILSTIPGHTSLSIPHVVFSFLFYPFPRPEDHAVLPINPLGWTLNYEMFFYICFAVALLLPRRRAIAAVTAGLLLLSIAGLVLPLPLPVAYWADPIVLEFALGMLLAEFRRTGWRMPKSASLLLAFCSLSVAIATAPLVGEHPVLRAFLWGMPALGMVAGLTLGEKASLGLLGRLLAKLGDASYALYLTHSILFLIVFVLLGHAINPHRIDPTVYAIGLIGLSVTLAFVCFSWFERPMTKLLRSSWVAVPAGA